MLVQIDGTPFDWFGNDQRFTLHMAVDDTTNDILAVVLCQDFGQLKCKNYL